eukprot:8011627-Ditylum_brightwellii.AAC.1
MLKRGIIFYNVTPLSALNSAKHFWSTYIKNWFNNLPADFQSMPIDKRCLVGKQTTIGWRRLLNSQLTMQWAILQDDYLHHIRLQVSSLNGTTWASHIVKLIWSQFFVPWTLRNEKQHAAQENGYKQH